MSGLSIKAVAIGLLIDIGGGLLAGTFFTGIYTAMLMSQGVPPADLAHRIMADKSFYAATVILGNGFLAGGAFVAARIARHREVAHAAVVGVLGIVISRVLAFGSGVDATLYPSWYRPVLYGVALPVALLAGYMAQRLAKPR